MTAPAILPRGLQALRSFADTPPRESCELCGAAIGEGHAHLLNPSQHALRCTCGPCALLFREGADAAWLRVPARFQKLKDLVFGDAEWDSLQLPIELAYVTCASDGAMMAHFPGPAGATDSPISPATWEALVTMHPQLGELESEIEAFLFHRLGGARATYRVSIDRCFELVGLMRKTWRGLGGGGEAWEAVKRFFADADRSKNA